MRSFRVAHKELGKGSKAAHERDCNKGAMNYHELNSRIVALETELHAIQERNRRVESHKSWETSRARLVSVTFVTYVTMLLVFSMIGSAQPYVDALVPTTGFFLSTFPLPFVRRHWEKWHGSAKKS